MTKQYITRKGTFDAGHRVMNEKMKCFNLHGHTYLVELNFVFTSMEDIGYQIDFKEIKRVGLQFIDDYLDHGIIVNPNDADVIHCARKTRSKCWEMSLNGINKYCNPTVENIAKEIFLMMRGLFYQYKDLDIYKVTLHETPNCYTECFADSISEIEEINFLAAKGNLMNLYTRQKGIINYDDRKQQ